MTEGAREREPGRVAVVGMGALCSLGLSLTEVAAGLYAPGRPQPEPAERLHEGALPFPWLAVPRKFWTPPRAHSAADTLRLGLAAAREALGGWQGEAAVVAGSTSGTALHFLDDYAARRNGKTGPRGQGAQDYLLSNPALALSAALRLRGPVVTVTNACASGSDAIGIGADLIRLGACKAALCGGMDALSLVPHTGFARLMVASSEPCRPFDRDRSGLNLGEGAAFLLLEEEASARARGARILGYVAGYGAHSDASHFTAPHPEGQGLAGAVRDALKQAGLEPDDLAFVNAHGTATRENDKVEGATLHRLLPDLPVWCTKGLTGHTLGAAGALEAIFTLTALNRGEVPPSAGFSTLDEEIGVAPTTDLLPLSRRAALSTSLGFGGCNAALVLQAGIS